MAVRYWLMKSEPSTFALSDLERVRVEPWTGVRNYMARNFMREMARGDRVLFYHSSCNPPGVAGLARVVRAHVVDETQFDPQSPYFDPKATRERPIWDCVEVEFVGTLPQFVPIERIRAEPALADMLLLRRGMRLSVQPVTAEDYKRIVALGRARGTAPAVTAPPTRRTVRRASAPRARRAAAAKKR